MRSRPARIEPKDRGFDVAHTWSFRRQSRGLLTIRNSPGTGCDASLYTCERAAESRALLVGDAASFIERLSSAGVKKALASAWRAAVVVNTTLAEPDMLDAASRFYDRREQWLFDECVRRSQAFFRRASDAYDNRFWSARAKYLPPERKGASPEGTDLMSDRQVHRIAEQLREADGIRLTTSRVGTVDRVPVVEGNRIVMRDGITVDGLEEPVRFVCGVDLVGLTRIVARSGDIASIIQEYFARIGPIDPRNLLLASAFLVGRGVLRASPRIEV